MKLSLGLTEANCNYRLTADDLAQRVKITADVDGTEHDYYFKVPGGWTAVITDYFWLVRAAHPGAKVTWEFVDD